MGRLIGLELHNFKSYRGTTTIGFGSSFFTSIIGPNGAGKSNMMDAISFVLGVQSTHLRSHNVKDLIYRGRKSASEANTSVDIDQDPTRAHVMAIYEKDNGDVLKLKRSITASGNSEYRINDLSVTSLNYSMVLKAENILIKARNFLVFQGDVEQIASQSPKDLTKLIETISGSNEYAKEYENLKEEHEKAHEFSNSVFSRRRTLNSESKQYKEQMAEQIEFEDKLTQKAQIIKSINLYKLFHNEKKHFQLIQDLKHKGKELKLLQRQLSTQESAYKALMAEYSKLVLESKQYSTKIVEISGQIDSTKRELIPIEANKRSLTSKISNLKTKINDLITDYKKQKNQISSIEKQLREAQKMFDEFQDKIASSISSSVTSQGQKEYEKLRAQFLTSGGSQLEEELALLENDKDSIKANITSLENQATNSLSRVSELERIISSELKSKLSDYTNEINDILTLKQEKIDSRNELIKVKEQFNYEELQLNSQLRDILLRLEELSSQQRESNKQKKLRENVSMLKRFFPKDAIKGLVYDLVRPSKQKYETALLTILGRNFDAIIVETTSVAYKCIELLKERRSGIATFIPLDSVVADQANLNYLRSIHDAVQPGIDILEYDDKSLEQAIHYVVGDTLVVDNIDLARKLKWDLNYKLNNKLVTLEGSVIHKSGLMTGGQQTHRSPISLNWDKNEWNSLNELREELVSKLASLQERRPKDLEINIIAEEISALDDKLPIIRNQKLSVERVIEDRLREISFQQDLGKSYKESINEKKKSLSKLDKEIEKINIQIRGLQNDVYSGFCSSYGFSNGIEDYENLHGSTLRVRAKERAQFVKEISTLSNKLSFENERAEETKDRKIKLESQVASFEEELLSLIALKQDLEENLDKLEAELDVLKLEEVDQAKLLKSKLKSSKLVESEVLETENDISTLGKAMTSIEEQTLKIDTERVNILKNCKIQNVNIPLKDGLLDSIPIGENSDNLVKGIYDIEIDYASDLDERYKESFTSKLEAELDVKLQNTIDQLERLTPNSKAIERLREAEMKLKEFDRDHTLARQQERKVGAKFQDIRNKRHELFMEAFEHISGKIDSIYKELTKSNASPLGGSAYLILEDEDSPYNSGIKYHAMPPMKRFRDMELLSGGEKTMAALALLFAIHSYQPSPFFVLDEVDAALDNSNVGKIANYIRKHAGPDFQFIVISLKNSLFEKSDALVGIYREQRENSSRTLTLDLREYPVEDVPINAI
ncbi:structural maintenance of chromosome protein 1 [Suhomyces tanzawaensis NRRL Y-17324]|uniref:Structural maintenance of chromosomes protein n=1 Tax=Suhomyces tanzawaensis NRRL Y-17324 TaxID=984487 RepID=A0A1E4SKH1_9ASCO|nr:structural maintenance of chromosome protein 1 [Suhomyces tanzawaensis NRRL Y-17324]ODV79922.1 structural maintenance of chromosome protein 1 [Suhomyces tanzawaensis NRRL Y-17324]